MPKILESRVKGMMKDWMPESQAYVIATARLKKRWTIKKKPKAITKKRKNKVEDWMHYV